MSIITLYLLASMAMVIYFDMTRYTIPNWLVASLIVLYPVMLYLSPQAVDWQGALVAFGITFAIGYLLFIKRLMGGGDIKLIIACGLWLGISSLVDFLFLMTIIGGIFALLLLLMRKALAKTQKKDDKPLPRILTVGAPVPYGVAIATSFVYMMWMGKVAGVSL